MNPVIFISGPYRGKTLADIEANVEEAARWFEYFLRKGWSVICPHTNSHLPASFCCFGYGHEIWLNNALALEARSNAVFMKERWRQSSGAKKEWRFAKEHGIPIFHHTQLSRIPRAEEWQEWFFNWQRTQNFKEVEERYLPNADATCKDGLQVETQAEEADSGNR